MAFTHSVRRVLISGEITAQPGDVDRRAESKTQEAAEMLDPFSDELCKGEWFIGLQLGPERFIPLQTADRLPNRHVASQAESHVGESAFVPWAARIRGFESEITSFGVERPAILDAGSPKPIGKSIEPHPQLGELDLVGATNMVSYHSIACADPGSTECSPRARIPNPILLLEALDERDRLGFLSQAVDEGVNGEIIRSAW
jgi:hypothetical protein